MPEEVPVNRTDIVILTAVSVLGGVVLASLLMTPELTPRFVNAAMISAVLLAFFLFIPVMGVRMFVDDRRVKDEEDSSH
ncbi:hypothetical protein [Natrialba swarupiae]|uniref:Uncharacterized protein n=1 Tax=Natrialba swarupiae TaxID=2448032 RepID=A0A5D5AU75_9EURY|nr:hypothetical protein [Natrialba swarupiae]TYT63130.1 hypothetical protein FYC77_05675 [Natrialba swarupiae]